MSGAVSDAAVEALLAAVDDGDVDAHGLTVEETGTGYRFSVPGTTETGLSPADLRAVARRHGAHVAEWYTWTRAAPTHAAERAFLEWVEGGNDGPVPEHRQRLRDGCERTWGQLRIAVTLADDGRRSYDLRHVADADAAAASLSTYEDPAAASDLVRFDDAGGYRPLKTAPTLASGWVYPEVDAACLVRTVETIYPATIANWHREREKRLDVTHWRETAERQTGIYDVVDELDGERVDWLAEACCVDSQCLKRRAWDETDDRQLDVPRGDGEFPCREPCSLVIAAAREVALAEREATGPVTLAVSPTERDQLDRILEAVATDELGDVRDGDLGDGANRIRARYLRAKLCDDEGRLMTAGDDDASSDRRFAE